MKQAYIVASFLYLCLSASAATEKQPVTLQELEKELVALSPKGRIVRSSRHLDIQRYNTMGLAYQRLDQLDSAAVYFERTQEVAGHGRDTL